MLKTEWIGLLARLERMEKRIRDLEGRTRPPNELEDRCSDCGGNFLKQSLHGGRCQSCSLVAGHSGNWTVSRWM